MKMARPLISTPMNAWWESDLADLFSSPKNFMGRRWDRYYYISLKIIDASAGSEHSLDSVGPRKASSRRCCGPRCSDANTRWEWPNKRIYLTTPQLTIQDYKIVNTAFDELLSGSLLSVTTATSHLSPVDRLMQLESEERATIKGIPTAKQLREVHETARSRMQAEDDEINKVS